MRFGLVLLLVGLPGAVMAAEDRYGPARRPDPALTMPQAAAAPPPAASTYAGPTLTWTGKASSPRASQPAPPPAAVRPQAVAAAPQPAPPQSRLPTGLYDGPATAAAPAPPPATQAPAARPAPEPSAPAAWPGATAALPPPPTAPPLNTAMTAYSAPRAYSVVREYGGTPDRIPPPPPQSAFTGREVSLDPGLLSGQRDEDPPQDEADEDIEQPARKSAKDRK